MVQTFNVDTIDVPTYMFRHSMFIH